MKELESIEEVINLLRNKLAGSDSVSQRLEILNNTLSEILSPDIVFINCEECEGSIVELKAKENIHFTSLLKIKNDKLYSGDHQLLLPAWISDLKRARNSKYFEEYLSETSSKSLLILPLYKHEALIGWVECHWVKSYLRLRREDISSLMRIVDYCSSVIDEAPARAVSKFEIQAQLDQALVRSRRLIEFGNIVIVRADKELRILDALGDCESLLGLSNQELVESKRPLTDFLHPDDVRILARQLRKMGPRYCELKEEIRVRNIDTGVERWLMLTAVPHYSEDNEFQGWEGFGIDITEKKLTERMLHFQSKRIQALYAVSQSLQVHLDPAIVTLKGLKALIDATQSDNGFGCFYDSNTGELELVAAQGLTQEYIDEIHKVINGKSLVRFSVEHKKGLRIDNIQADARAAQDIAKREGVKSTIVVPLLFENEVLGAIVLFCRRANRYSDDDFNLVQAAANQIGLAARQAESYVTEKQHASSLKTLYRLSHELTKLFSVREIVEHALPIIQEELACKRMWMGIMNEQNSHLVGQAGYGPGIRKSITNLQIELSLRHDFLDEAIKTKQPVIVGSSDKMECSGLNMMIKRLELSSLVIVPLVSLGQVVGVLIVEPASTSSVFVRKKLPLLRSMVNEIATVILARRFEAKMADSDKMRMAGVLASGVAHNFNNLLQAVMGQASLIEMQVADNSQVVKSARTIVDAATKGAALIKQLLSFSKQGEKQSQKLVSITRMLSESEDLYRSVLGSEISLEIDSNSKIPPVMADQVQIQQVLMNLVVNAKEAIESKENPTEPGKVIISTLPLRIRSGEIDPELAPGHYLRIDIQDNGVGMNDEKLQRCFEPFFTTKNVDASTGIGLEASGLGLSSAYSIVKQHEGVVTARSNLGKGAVFSVYLPLTASASMELMDLDVNRVDIPTRQRRQALFLKLDQYAQAAMRTTLESFGFQGEVLYSEDSVISKVESSSSEIGLVIIDAERLTIKPSMLVDSINKVDQNIYIVLLSSSDRGIKSLKRKTNVKIIEKPISVWVFRSLIQRIIDETATLDVTKEVTEENKKEESTEPKFENQSSYANERIH